MWTELRPPLRSLLLLDDLALRVSCFAGLRAVCRLAASATLCHQGVQPQVERLLASLPEPCIYVLGGRGRLEGALRDCRFAERLDLAHGASAKWETLPCLPAPREQLGGARSACAATVLGGVIYVLGGSSAGFVLCNVDSFQPELQIWQQEPAMNQGRAGCAATTAAGNIFVVGGRTGSAGHELELASCERYDGSGRWEFLAPLPSACYGCAAASWKEHVYVVGGYSEWQALSRVISLHGSASEASWQELPSMSVARYSCAAACVQGCLYVAGGHNGMEALDLVEVFDPAAGDWDEVQPMQHSRYGCGATASADALYIIGGHDGLRPCAIVERLDLHSEDWSCLPSLNTALYMCAVTGQWVR